MNKPNQYYIYTLLLISILFQTQNTAAQGCVAVRQMGGLGMCSTNSYNMNKGDIQIGTNYRYFHSWRHFVGTEEQPQRQITGGGIGPDGKERGNAVNIYSHAIDLNFSYALNDRLQINATLPYVNNERSQVLKQKTPVKDTLRYSVYAQGIADARLSLNYWLVDPKKVEKGNVMIGLGVKLNTGSHTRTDDAPQSDGTIKNIIMDQAIQPGDGGIGFSVELQTFRQITGSLYGFANGYYLFNPRESNGTFKRQAKPGLEGYELYASPDQYFARAGFMTTVDKQNNLTVSLAARLEGIPAYDVFGGQVAFRRPGYVVAVEYGFAYSLGKHSFSLFIPYNVVKNRIQSASDIARQNLENSVITDPSKYVHVQGDAAFADYSINIGYSYRFSLNNKMKVTMKH